MICFLSSNSSWYVFNGLVVKALDSQSRDPMFKTTGWLQGRLSLSSLRDRWNEYQDFFFFFKFSCCDNVESGHFSILILNKHCIVFFSGFPFHLCQFFFFFFSKSNKEEQLLQGRKNKRMVNKDFFLVTKQQSR